MSEQALGANESVPLRHDTSQKASPSLSAGAMLRHARLAQGLEIAALADSLKVPAKKIEALEEDRFDLLPDLVFVRALAASVCRSLKIDPGPILENLPDAKGPQLARREDGINVTFRGSGARSGLAFRDQLSKPLVLAILALVLGALALLIFPLTSPNQAHPVTKNPDTVPVMQPAKMASMVIENPLLVEPGSQPASLGLASSEGLQAVMPAAPASDAMQPGKPVPTASAPLSDSGSPTSLLLVKARGSSWVEVTDANRVVQVRKTLASGEVVSASGATPLSVVVGRADNAEVLVRGKSIDLNSVAKNNVARFEVK